MNKQKADFFERKFQNWHVKKTHYVHAKNLFKIYNKKVKANKAKTFFISRKSVEQQRQKAYELERDNRLLFTRLLNIRKNKGTYPIHKSETNKKKKRITSADMLKKQSAIRENIRLYSAIKNQSSSYNRKKILSTIDNLILKKKRAKTANNDYNSSNNPEWWKFFKTNRKIYRQKKKK